MLVRVARLGRRALDYLWRSAVRDPLAPVMRAEGMISVAEARLLYELAREVVTGCIVEVGSYRGRSTIALARGSQAGHNVPVFAFDPHEESVGILGGKFGPEDRAWFFRNMLRSGCYRIVRLVELSSAVVSAGWHRPVSLLWIDGDHSYEGVRSDFDCWLPHLVPGAAIALDDATDERIGPCRVIRELLETGQFQESQGVGKVRVVRRVASPVPGDPALGERRRAEPA
jgi:hypothetical protein